tara:strand:+ start:4738 stop:4968 length:231 start_codon:yes stop_codon:yes gene_type:complete
MSAHERLITLVNEFHQDMYEEHIQNSILLDDVKEYRKLLQVIYNICNLDEHKENPLSLEIKNNFELAKEFIGEFNN